jgi:hypothetical protein
MLLKFMSTSFVRGIIPHLGNRPFSACPGV